MGGFLAQGRASRGRVQQVLSLPLGAAVVQHLISTFLNLVNTLQYVQAGKFSLTQQILVPGETAH